MKKFIVTVLGAAIVLGAVTWIIYENRDDHVSDTFKLSTEQKAAVQRAVQSGKDLPDDIIDTFTLGQGRHLLMEYFDDHDLQYKIGSKKYIKFLAGISESRKLQKKPEFVIIDSYASVYLAELQMDEPIFLRFHLKQSMLNKTIKEVRAENS